MIEMRYNMTFSSLTLLALASASCDANDIVNSSIKLIQSRKWNGYNITFLVMWCHYCWCQCHISWMPTVSSMVLLQLLGQDDQNEMQHDFWSYDAILSIGCVMYLLCWCSVYVLVTPHSQPSPLTGTAAEYLSLPCKYIASPQQALCSASSWWQTATGHCKVPG